MPYIFNLPHPSVNYIEDDLGISFVEEQVAETKDVNSSHDSLETWKMFFDGETSKQGNGVGILLQNNLAKKHILAFLLNFACTNNTAEFEALFLWD